MVTLTQKPHINVTLATTIDQIADNFCEVCGALCKKVYISHTFGNTDRGNPVIHTNNSAGYECPTCTLQTFSPEALIEMESKSWEILEAYGYEDLELRDILVAERRELEDCIAARYQRDSE